MLGSVEVRRDGEPVPVPGGKTAEVLVRLALDAGTFVRTDRLVEDVWAEDAVNTRRNTLQSKIAKLRRACGDPRLIVSGDGGYTLAVEPSNVDALAVLRDAVTAAELLDAGDDREAADLSAAALARYRGDLLQSAGEWAAPHRARLDEARMALMETRFAAQLGLGGAGEEISDLESAVATYPYQEGLWELLITALYRAGRQADALATYQRVRGLLADELGLAPGPRLQELERQILVQASTLGIGDRAARALETHARPGNLPSLAAELVGRETEIAAVSDLLASHRLVEIVGPGGIGKTAVAIATGRRLTAPGGVWLVRLETATTADDVLDTLITALHVTGGEAALLERLKASDAVVILDNCEHVLDAAAALAERLVDAAPALRILCTSQVALDVDAEAVLELAPLALPDAVALFTRRAAARHRDAGSDAVHDLCRSLDGLPLAIELAAARTKTLSIEEISRRLDDRFTVLRDPASRKPERRRALKATIQWSYELLFPDDQRGLWALATFAGGAPLPAVEYVLEALDVPASAAIDVVGRLASRSLVIVDDARPGVRYRLLDSIRAFALEAMADERADRARARGARRVVRRCRSGLRPTGCAAVARPSISRSLGPSAPISTPPWPGASRAIHCSRSASSTGSAGPGSSSATAEASTASSRPSTQSATRLRSQTGPARCCSRAGSRRRRVTSNSPATTSRLPPNWRRRSATSTCRRAVATTWPTSCPITASSVTRWS